MIRQRRFQPFVIWHPYHARVALVLSVLLLVFTIGWSSRFRYGMFSNFFFVDDSQEKTKIAKQFLNTRRSSVVSNHTQTCFAINSIPRIGNTYVERCVASMLEARDVSRRGNKVIIAVMDMQPNPSLCDTLPNDIVCMHRVDVLAVLPKPLQDSVKAADQTVASSGRVGFKWRAKQKIDYALSLYWCGSINCTYCAVLEDDAIISRDGIDRIDDSLTSHMPPQWSLLRLYRSDFWEGFEDAHVPYFVLTGFVGAIFPMLFILLLRVVTHYPRSTPIASVITVWSLFCAIWFPLFPFMLGKQHLLFIGTRTTGGVVPSLQFYAGAVAIMYPTEIARKVSLDILNQPFASPAEIDLYLGAALGYNVQDTYELLPNPFTHVGFISSAESKRFRSTWFSNHRVMSGSFHNTQGSQFA